MNIIRATKHHIAPVSRLFDLYRQFYDCASDMALAKQFISDRINNDESVIFLAMDDDGKTMGFTQLYPSFCSVEAVKILILYDLYVDAPFRQRGVAEGLMQAAKKYAVECKTSRIDLLTAKTNYAGQALYEKLQYKDSLKDFLGYSLNV